MATSDKEQAQGEANPALLLDSKDERALPTPTPQPAPTDAIANAENDVNALKHALTAPAVTTQRSRAGSRASALLAGRKRAATVATEEPFHYKFDSISSDSESSSSSEDEDEGALAKKRRSSEPQKKTRDARREDRGPDEDRERRRFLIGNDYLRTKGRVSRKDGRLKISINETANSGVIAKALGQSIRNHLDIPSRDGVKKKAAESQQERQDGTTQSDVPGEDKDRPIPRLNIVIMVIGSRGDIQPFVKIGKVLKEEHGHRVRVASHPVFKDVVEDVGLDFFDAGGDPSELMAFMVKNPGLIPNIQTLRGGEISKRRSDMGIMFEGFWKACISDSTKDKSPFIADAIIANPPSMAHVHIAERLGIPLHIMFTFPYTPTTQFPHPLANIKARKSNVDAGYVNFMSYPLVEMMTWQGLGDIVNHFREKTLHLEPVSSLWAPGALYRMKVPYTYMWSPQLVPKPSDWGPEIDISGYVFLESAKDYQPAKELADFLDAGEPPVYIGFGSIVVDDPNEFTEMIFQAIDMVGVRALVSKGWGGFGRDNDNTPKNIFMLGNIPHDWLFPKVKAVVHHGGAGTTAIGLKCGRPTMIVPFFGDQPFWGGMVAEARAGAFQCIPYKKLTAERLAEGIRQCLTEEAQQNVQKIAESISKEGDGAKNAVEAFHRSLPLTGRHNMRCSILQDRVAVWKMRKSSLRLSAVAAQMLSEKQKFRWDELKTIRHQHWNDFDGPGEPFTGGIGALTDSLYGIGEGFGMVPIRMATHIRKREEHERKKRKRQKMREERQRQKHAHHSKESTTKQHSATPPPPPKREDTGLTTTSTLSADPTEPLSAEMLDDLNWGLKRAGTAILTMPNDLHMAIAQGLHNAPRLWGDGTIRKPVKIKGVKSGFTAARKEFVYGIYDGWTGLVMQPKDEWEDGDTVVTKVAGLGTGLGKGVGGFVLKNVNAFFAPPGFVVKGLIKHVEKRANGPGSRGQIRRSRIRQGAMELHELRLREGKHESDGEQLRQIENRVERGWAVYEDLWNTAQQDFGPGGSVVGKYRMKREKKRWDVNGALANVDVVDRTLQARKEGYDVGDVAPAATTTNGE